MPPDLWSLIPLFTVVAGLACLAVAVILWMLTNRQMKMTRRETDALPDAGSTLARDRISHRRAWKPRSTSPGRPCETTCAPPGESKPGRRTRSFPDVRENQDPRNEPTLIAIPDLGAVRRTNRRARRSELGERHGEAWTLAAAGMPPRGNCPPDRPADRADRADRGTLSQAPFLSRFHRPCPIPLKPPRRALIRPRSTA